MADNLFFHYGARKSRDNARVRELIKNMGLSKFFGKNIASISNLAHLSHDGRFHGVNCAKLVPERQVICVKCVSIY